MGKLYKVVFSGGPCAGKTTAISRVRTFLENRGFIVLTVPEAATVAMSNGIIVYPNNFENFQLAITKVQSSNEKIFMEFAESLSEKTDKDVIVLLDRAIIDGSAYCSDDTFNEILAKCSRPKKDEMLDNYDVVLYLVTAANGAENFYGLEGVRYEGLEEARNTDEKTLNAWKKHKNLIIFDNIHKSFEAKMREVVGEVCKLLNITHTYKLPKRYILLNKNYKIPDDIHITQFDNEKIFIKKMANGEEGMSKNMYTFIRCSMTGGFSRYTLKTVKLENNQRIEKKENLTFRQYESLKHFSDTERMTLKQSRKLFSVGKMHCEINSYDPSILSTNLLSIYSPEKEETPDIPAFLKEFVGEEVTHDYRFSSHYLALNDKNKSYEFSHLFKNGKKVVYGDLDDVNRAK